MLYSEVAGGAGDWALQERWQKESKRIKKSVACGLLVKLLKVSGGVCRKKRSDPANQMLPRPRSMILEGRGERYGASGPVF
jgi:hypothetical protein